MSILSIRQRLRRLAMGVAGAGLALTCTLTQAANFTVTPVRVELSQQRPSAALTVKNEMTDESVVVELRTMAWTQNGGEDVYAPAQDLLATPPIFTLAPGATQVIRVGLRHPPTDDREVCFRLFLREVPPPPKPGFAGVQIALEMRLPVFAKPRTPAAPQLKWRAETQPDGALALTVSNEGTAHAQVANLVVTAAGTERPVATHPEFAYVLPGQTRRLLLQRAPGAPAVTGGALRLKAYSDAGDIDSALAPETR